jgi:hypothetical protein
MLAVFTVAVGCSSGKPAVLTPTATPTTSTAPAAHPSDAAVQHYVDAVNALCDALLPKVMAVTDGGRIDVPLREFFRQLRAHQRLRHNFDRQLAAIPVPAAAHAQAAALAAYIRYANKLDARRLRAARAGAAAYRREIQAELASAAEDPSIAARAAAGFHDSCNAR